MRHLIDLDAPGAAGAGLLGPGATCQIRDVRGPGAGPYANPSSERLYFVLSGAPVLEPGGVVLGIEDLVHAPPGAQARLSGKPADRWLEVVVPVPEDQAGAAAEAQVVRVDRARFEGGGFAHQSLVDRSSGSRAVRINMIEVAPGAGSPDFHIHAFDQLYLILQGRMQVEIGVTRMSAGPMTLVYLPAGVVHRNYNVGPGLERHISLLVPEPAAGAVFDYAVEIHPREAEMMQAVPEHKDV